MRIFNRTVMLAAFCVALGFLLAKTLDIGPAYASRARQLARHDSKSRRTRAAEEGTPMSSTR